ncbi:MAG: pyridoxamine 5'-phosphate oxidase family protein [Candidatus Saccharimonadales bacterium]
MEVAKLIKDYLAEAKIMQLATTDDNQPWACSVHIAADSDLNLYWLSNSFRRHSIEIEKNPKVAATIPIKFPENPVIGISVEGHAQTTDSTEAIELYDKKFGLTPGFKQKLLEGNADEKVYVLRPRLWVLFDLVNFPDKPRQEWRPKG